MSADDWWAEIERHLLNRNWTGVLICADGLSEAGEERLADCVRWVARQTIEIHHWDFRSSGGEDYWYGTIRLPDGVEPFSWSFRADSCRLWYLAVDQRRKQMQEFLK